MGIQKELISYQSEAAKRFRHKVQDYNKQEMTWEMFRTHSCKVFREIQKMPYGKDRRDKILCWCKSQIENWYWHIPYGFIVNSKTQMIIKKDPDLQYLIKKGMLVQINKRKVRSLWTGCWSSTNYLVLTDKYDKQGNLK